MPHKGEFIAFSTNTAEINLPMALSRDLVTWTTIADPADPKNRLDGMPLLASWVEKDRTWAPEVIENDGKWLLYYTATAWHTIQSSPQRSRAIELCPGATKRPRCSSITPLPPPRVSNGPVALRERATSAA